MPTLAAADLALHKPIRLNRVGPGASDSVIWSGVASAADLLRGYPMGDAEVTAQARRDTAAGLVGVPIVSPEDHQGWQQAHSRGEPYTERHLGTVIDAALDDAGRAVWRASIHDAEYNRRIALPPSDPDALPDVSVAYEADLGDSTHPEADFAQLGRRIRHLALVPRGRDPHAHIVRDAFADGASTMKLDQIKAKYPGQYKRARAALRNANRLGYGFADAISLDKAIPLIQELMKDEIGKLVLHAIVNAPEELKEIEMGAEDEAVDPNAPPMEDAMDPKTKSAMADAVAQGVATALAADRTERAAIDARLKLIETERASRLAAADADALATRARETASALDNAAVPRPAGFDPANPTAAMCDAADVALRKGLSAPRQHFGALSTAGKRWGGDGRRLDIQAAADGDTETTLADLDA